MKRILQHPLYQSYACLLAGMLLLIASGPKWHFSLATWIYPLLLLRYLTLRKGVWPLLLFFAAYYMSMKIAYTGVVPVPGVAGLIVLLIISLTAALPYFVHVSFSRPSVFLGTLLFPMALVGAEFAASFGPYGTWGSLANTQFENKILLQLASVTGLWGITFVTGWTASVVNWLWTQTLEKRTFIQMKAYLACMLIVVLFGAVRWLMPHQSNRNVKVAGVAVRMSWNNFNLNELSKDTLLPEFEPQRLQLINNASKVLEMASAEAKKGASIIVGAEGNIFLLKRDEPAFFEKAKATAREHGIYLFLGMGVPIPGKTPFVAENKVAVFSPEGKLVYQFYKANPVPGEPCLKGDGILPVIDSPYGRLSTVICYDADFPGLVKQAGEKEIDLLLIPANDWQEITPYHTQMALFRGVENGTSLVRETTNGLAAMADANGKVMAQVDYFTHNGELSMSAELPRQRKMALYPYIGDAFAWMCLLGVGVLVTLSLSGKRAILEKQNRYA